jgi:hypothetical protein
LEKDSYQVNVQLSNSSRTVTKNVCIVSSSYKINVVPFLKSKNFYFPITKKQKQSNRSICKLLKSII